MTYSNPAKVNLFRQTMFLPMRLNSVADSTAPPKKAMSLGMQAVCDRLAVTDEWKVVKTGDQPIADHQEANREFSERVYFHPFIQNYLYGDRLLRFERAETKRFHTLRVIAAYGVDVSDEGQIHNHFAVDLQIERCEIVLALSAGVVIFLIDVATNGSTDVRRFYRQEREKPEKKLADAKSSQGHKVPCSSKFSMAEVAALHNCLRRIFPAYLETAFASQYELGPDLSKTVYGEQLLPLDVEFDPSSQLSTIDRLPDHVDFITERDKFLRSGQYFVAPWWKKILGPILALESAADKQPLLVQVVDERMPTMVFVATEDKAYLTDGEKVRLCFADSPGRTMPYAEEFMAERWDKHHYSRFSHFGTDYFASSYSFVCLTSFDPAPENHNYFIYELRRHMARSYRQMFFLVQMQKAALLMMSNWMSEGVAAKSGDLRSYENTIQTVRNKFMEFTHSLWFTNISNQEQPRELYAWLQGLAGNLDLYKEVEAESVSAREELEVGATQRQAETTYVLSVLAAMFTSIGLPLAAWTPLHDAKIWNSSDSLFCALTIASILSCVVAFALHKKQLSPQSGKFLHFLPWANVLMLIALCVCWGVIHVLGCDDETRGAIISNGSVFAWLKIIWFNGPWSCH